MQALSLYGPPIPAEFEPGLVSVVMPAYNRAALLPEAMQSVWEQTYRPVELLIVNDGSTDATAEAARQTAAAWPDDPEFRVLYVMQPNAGAATARNQGLVHSHGEFIQYLDSDDVLARHKLAGHVGVLKADEALDVVWSDWRVVASEQLQAQLAAANQTELNVPAWERTDRFLPHEPWPTLTRRRFLAPLPAWNQKTRRWDDWEYSLRLMAARPQRAFLPGVTNLQREHKQGRITDFNHNLAGIQRGLVDAGEAGVARDGAKDPRPDLEQLTADRYWDVFLEALKFDMADPAKQAISGACRYARRPGFKLKVWLLRLMCHLTGPKRVRALLARRYLLN